MKKKKFEIVRFRTPNALLLDIQLFHAATTLVIEFFPLEKNWRVKKRMFFKK